MKQTISLIAVLLLTPAAVLHAVQVRDLRCEYLQNPLGVDAAKPRLSWILDAGEQKPKIRGQRQTAYRVLVASTTERLAQNQGDLWDSGRVASDQSTLVEYSGEPLESRLRCHWKVRVWDKDGAVSPWSDAATWTMGLLNPKDWQARWITMKTDRGPAHPWLRHTFDVTSAISRGEIYVITPGHYELFLNGKKVGTDVLMPAHVNLKKRYLCNVYDVSALLQKGTNCVALWMGPGWYQPRYGNPYGSPIVRTQLEIQSPNGRTVIGTDASWRVADSCISQIGGWGWSDMGGERWDARRFVKEWNQAGFDDSTWASAAEVPAPNVQCSWQALPGSRLRQPIAPKKISRHKGKWVMDFGRTLTGWMRLRLAALKSGQQITIDYADMDNPVLEQQPNADGFQTFNQRDIYVAGAQEQDVFCSKFNQHAFRYAVIAGLSRAPAPDDAEAMTVETDLEKAGDFSCSNELFNRIHQVTVNTYHTQIPCGVLGGGEAREKVGYGDGGAFLSGMLYNLHSDAFFRKWLGDWCDGQRADGFLGHTAPEYYPAGGGPSWGGQASELVRRLYLYYGDRRAVADAYPVLKKYVNHLESHTERDILRYFNPYAPGNYAEWYFLGDWVAPGASADQHGFIFEPAEQREFFNNCYRVLLWEQLAQYAGILKDHDEQQRCEHRLAVLRPLIHRMYYDPAKKTYKANRQAYLAIALYSRIVPPELRAAIFKQLEDDVLVKHNGHLDTGLLGTFLLLDLFIHEDRNDVAATVISRTTFPGWGFLVKQRQVTTWPETWSGWGSQIIQVVGTAGAWFYEGLAGIRPDPTAPGFKKIIIKPAVVGDLRWVKAHFDSPYGRIVSNWQRDGNKLVLEVTVPDNTTATIFIPASDAGLVTESGRPLGSADAVKFLRIEDGRVVAELGGGRYQFASMMNAK